MRIGGSGSQGVDVLQSDAAQFRGTDFVVSNAAAFIGTGNLSNTAAVISHVQLFNPAGSGVTVIVDGMIFAMGTAGRFLLASHDTELTTDGGAWLNALMGGAAGAAHVRTQNNATVLGTAFGGGRLAGNTGEPFVFPFGLQIPAGAGILLSPTLVNVSATVTFWGREI